MELIIVLLYLGIKYSIDTFKSHKETKSPA